jgi:hypothetical protein
MPGRDTPSTAIPAAAPEPVVPPPAAATRPIKRDFAVKPTADSGEQRRGERPGGPEAIPADQPSDSVRSAPVVDPALESSVFAEDLESEDDTGRSRRDRLRDGLGRGGAATVCPNCGRDVPGGRRFCSCGEQLVVTARAPAEETAPAPSALTSFWRRLTGTGQGPRGDERSWGQRAKDTGARRGLRYATRMSASTRFGRIGMLLAGGAGMLMVLGPLRQQVKDIPDLFRSPEPAEVDWRAAGPCDAAANEDEKNPWQTQWPATDQPPSEVTCPGVFDTITGTFAQPADIDRFTIIIGQTSGQNPSINRGQPVMSPAVLTIEFTHDGDREPTVISPVQLEDTALQQEFGAKIRDATGFTITIDEVVGPDEHPWPELEIVQIGQVAFFHD